MSYRNEPAHLPLPAQLEPDASVQPPELRLAADHTTSNEHRDAFNALSNLTHTLSLDLDSIRVARRTARSWVERLKDWAFGAKKLEDQLDADAVEIRALREAVAVTEPSEVKRVLLPRIQALHRRIQDQYGIYMQVAPTPEQYVGSDRQLLEIYRGEEFPALTMEHQESPRASLMMLGEGKARAGVDIKKGAHNNVFGEDYGELDAEHDITVLGDGNGSYAQSAEAVRRLVKKTRELLQSVPPELVNPEQIRRYVIEQLPQLPEVLADLPGDGGATILGMRAWPELGFAIVIKIGDCEGYTVTNNVLQSLDYSSKAKKGSTDSVVKYAGLTKIKMAEANADSLVRVIPFTPGMEFVAMSDGPRNNLILQELVEEMITEIRSGNFKAVPIALKDDIVIQRYQSKVTAA